MVTIGIVQHDCATNAGRPTPNMAKGTKRPRPTADGFANRPAHRRNLGPPARPIWRSLPMQTHDLGLQPTVSAGARAVPQRSAVSVGRRSPARRASRAKAEVLRHTRLASACGRMRSFAAAATRRLATIALSSASRVAASLTAQRRAPHCPEEKDGRFPRATERSRGVLRCPQIASQLADQQPTGCAEAHSRRHGRYRCAFHLT